MEATIDIDIRPYVVAEIGGRARKDSAGLAIFEPDSTPRWHAIMERCLGHDFTVKVTRRKKRSNKANAYLFGVVYVDILSGLRELAEAVGELPVFTEAEDLHEAMKWTFLRRVYVLPGAGNMEAMPRSSKLSSAEFGEFVSKVKAWAAERHIWVREPHEAGLAA